MGFRLQRLTAILSVLRHLWQLSLRSCHFIEKETSSIQDMSVQSERTAAL